MEPIAKLALFALDARDPQALAQFYSAITGWPVVRDDGDWVQLESDTGATLAFQLAPDHEPPVWPSAEHPQQAHIDFDVPDLKEGERRVLELGAVKAKKQPGRSFTVYLDPAGHPFCLVLNKKMTWSPSP
jgi:catechol 2,3-dioxygenase-like lactoylglutathione lyase family enzyme